ncbi:MAG: hypothetical protein NZM12_05030 [Steroidobacteraceae bacterium]|nr:hypothetical protein [Steroidobacteraceae bacterium]MDW8260084.1 lipase [Gammaproteobacteria bacterium]
MHRLFAAVPLTLIALIVAGCANSSSNGSNNGLSATNPTSGNLPGTSGTTPLRTDFRALFVAPDPGPPTVAPVLPYPTDLYFSGSNDGTLNLPANSLQPGVAAINELDGYSTTATIVARFSGPIDPASLTAASVRVLRVVVDNTTKATVGVSGVLGFGTDFSATVNPDPATGGSQLVITPLRPLVPSSGTTNVGYLVVLTNGIRSTSGAAANADTNFEQIKAALPTCASITNATLNGICRLVGAHFAIATNPAVLGLNPANIVLTFSFSTQNTRDTLNIVAQQIGAAPPRPIVARPTGLTTAQALPGLQGKANVFAGTLQIPYYLNRAQPLTGTWLAAGPPPAPLSQTSRALTRFNPVPAVTESLTIPVLFTVPNAASAAGATPPPGGWRVAIFQHGITGNRTQMLPLADAFADAGFVVVAIDQPLHGLTAPTNPLYASPMNPLYGGTAPPGASSYERTFDLDLVNNATGAAGPDGQIDPSGTHFINLASLLTSRDNLRQAAADLVTLTRAIPQLDFNGDATPDVNGARIHFVGHSLGGIVGTVYAALPSAVRSITGAMPGGGVAQLLRDSPTFGPRILAGLAAQGLPSTALDQFFRDAQNAVDSGDPLNYIAVAAGLRPYHLIQVVGNGTTVLPDQVVPNSATQRLIVAGNLTRVSTPGPNAVSRGFVNFIAGDHGSILSPAASLAATVEMQTQTVTFAASDGALIAIANPTVIQP